MTEENEILEKTDHHFNVYLLGLVLLTLGAYVIIMLCRYYQQLRTTEGRLKRHLSMQDEDLNKIEVEIERARNGIQELETAIFTATTDAHSNSTTLQRLEGEKFKLSTMLRGTTYGKSFFEDRQQSKSEVKKSKSVAFSDDVLGSISVLFNSELQQPKNTKLRRGK